MSDYKFLRSLKARETPAGKPLMHKDKYILGRKCACSYRAAVGMLSCLQGSTRMEISMSVHQCAYIFNNPRLVHKRAATRIVNYLASISTYVDLPDGNRRLTTRGVV